MQMNALTLSARYLTLLLRYHYAITMKSVRSKDGVPYQNKFTVNDVISTAT
jgi:hypothetical protein